MNPWNRSEGGRVSSARASWRSRPRFFSALRQRRRERQLVVRLDDVVPGAEPHRLLQGAMRAVRGDDDDLGIDAFGTDLLEQFEPVEVGQFDVEQDGIRPPVPRGGQRRRRRRRRGFTS